ncbi:glutamine--fructose-6-phosphate transaminase (isomerizing) [Pseudobdellovibrio exovorus]|uniref:Glutamine--fructose-6-phosphate aminotransferase [isomerizing] n=1 Tax=Pseudobdellovibrio exovorus JSS TaxID=1184267 RepID=M4VAE2_9BACT|nr:glutamine--fructose-6-phosphate transaminase (isomerizing) [Pseudobdellovibrio exovorus]AGH96377.1 glucosamine--fructose-6-phosphate aminotransferase (isomerizing) [Pseudobdellovibrio exovorus JSS]
MCGIVGYLGPQDPKNIIVEGLKKLEYRGYDSAGVAILNDGKTKRVRAEGKLKNLEEKLAGEKFNGHLGIGHTRWATHGAAVERNAHPHQVGEISIVHNGIIENYLEIKQELLSRGADISSDTDSELVAHLINEEIKKTQNLLQAVQTTLSKLIGAFSVVVMWEKSPDELVAFKDGPPLIVGLNADKNEYFVVSDVQAALQHTKDYVYLEDREVVHIQNKDVKYYSALGAPLKKQVVTLDWNPEQIEKMGFKHFMLKEIYEQPRAVAMAIQPHIDTDKHEVNLKNLGFDKPVDEVFKSIERIIFVACGTSFYAGNVAQYLIEQVSGIPVQVDIASEFRYRKPIIPKNTLVITISQSGETADTLAAIRMAKEKGALTLSITNVQRSSIDREAHGHLYMNSGVEVGVASTKAFTSTLALANLLALQIAKARGTLSRAQEQEYVKSLLAIPSQIEVVLAFDKYFSEASKKLQDFKGFLYLGRGVSYPIALEGALKLKELAYMHAEGYAAGEMKHGPLALIDARMAIVVVAPTDELIEKTISNLQEAKARGGKIISIGTDENPSLKSMSEYYLSIPATSWMTSPLLSVVPLQLMAYHLADSLGYDVDQPRNLAKSVTVE